PVVDIGADDRGLGPPLVDGLRVRLELTHVLLLAPPLAAHGAAGYIVDGVPVRFVADRQAGKGVTEDVDRIRGHVRSALRVIGAQGDADGDRGSGGVDELLQPLEVIWSDGDLFVVLRLLPLRGPERPPVE